MPSDHHESPGRLTRDQQKQLLALACAADRLEWQIQAKHLERASRRSLAISRIVRTGLDWLPRIAALQPDRTAPRWRRAFFWLRACLGLFL